MPSRRQFLAASASAGLANCLHLNAAETEVTPEIVRLQVCAANTAYALWLVTPKGLGPAVPPEHVTGIELVVDGNVVDLNRIRLPADTPIIDKRFPGK